MSWLSPPRRRYGAIDVDRSEWGGLESPAPERPASTPRGPEWRVGQSVRHAKFGVGVIVGAEGRGSDARVQVNFRESGVKWLALEYARLEPVSS